MAIIDADGLFSGSRMRSLTDVARLHSPHLIVASNGFGRLEVDYHAIIGRVYQGFQGKPAETDLYGWIREYHEAGLLFLYECDGQLWGQWDTRPELLPKYKTAKDKRSPDPPEPDYSTWKQSHKEHRRAFPMVFQNVSEGFSRGIGVGGVKVLEKTDIDCLPTNRKNHDSQVGGVPMSSSVIKQYPKLREALYRYLKEPGVDHVYPTDRTVVDVLDAAGGASEDEVVGCLVYMYMDRGLKPGTRNGPRHWSWFKTTVQDHFEKKRQRADVANPCGCSEWQDRNEYLLSKAEFDAMTDAF